ncbi:MAG: HDIG domain-containing protein [Firmicutes bacterium]|nr:HDIG domain-containing protein [Bacillota bacterium]
MIELIEAKLNLRIESGLKRDYEQCIIDLARQPILYSLEGFAHHRHFSRLDHSLHVSFQSYRACKKLGLDYRSAARGGLLHDLYFYDSHRTKPERGIHCFCHPAIALENALEHFTLNEVEKDIIVKHMWPVTMSRPQYKESFVVTLMDKYCASKEVTLYAGKFTPTHSTQF